MSILRIASNGKGSSVNTELNKQKIEQKINSMSQKNLFETAVVIDYVSDPDYFLSLTYQSSEDVNSSTSLRAKYESASGSSISNKSKKSIRDLLKAGDLSVKNSELVDLMPMNSIIGYPISDLKSEKDFRPQIYYPFFSSHLCMPVKPGEQVWIIYEKIGEVDVGYWISRKSGSKFTEDVNYTFHQRDLQTSLFMNNAKFSSKNYLKKITEIRKTYNFNEINLSGNSGGSQKVSNTVLVSNSFSYNNDFFGKAVTNYKKKCGDLVFQGSNSTAVVLTNNLDIVTSLDGLSEADNNSQEYGRLRLMSGIDIPEKRTVTGQIIENEIKNVREQGYESYEYSELNKTNSLLDIKPDIEVYNAASDFYIEGDGTIRSYSRILYNYAGKGSEGDSVLRMTGEEITIAKSVNRDYSLSQITLLDENIGIEAPKVVSIRAPGGEIKIAHGSSENPTEDAKIMMNQGNEAYVKISVLEQIINTLAQQIVSIAPAAVAAAGVAGDVVTAANATAIVSAGTTPIDTLVSSLGSEKIFGS